MCDTGLADAGSETGVYLKDPKLCLKCTNVEHIPDHIPDLLFKLEMP